jgi:hypothetical protein
VHIYAYALDHAEVGKFSLSYISRLGVQFNEIAVDISREWEQG